MTPNIHPSVSVAEIEQKIAKVTADLENARALEYVTAEKTLLASQKLLVLAQERVRDLLAKASTTPAAVNRLTSAKAALAEKEAAMTVAEAQFNKVNTEHEKIKKFTKKVEHVLASKKLSKKIKFSKKERAALKIFRKSEKAKIKLAKEEEKLEVQLSTEKKPSGETTSKVKRLKEMSFKKQQPDTAITFVKELETKIDAVVEIPVLEQTPLEEIKPVDPQQDQQDIEQQQHINS